MHRCVCSWMHMCISYLWRERFMHTIESTPKRAISIFSLKGKYFFSKKFSSPATLRVMVEKRK